LTSHSGIHPGKEAVGHTDYQVCAPRFAAVCWTLTWAEEESESFDGERQRNYTVDERRDW
jgi:hypothetical protein